MSVADILKAKGTAVMTVRPSETIHAVAKRLQQEGVGAMVVSSDGDSLDGIITERDVAINLAVYGTEFHTLPASALMSAAVVTCAPEDSVAEVAKVMTNQRLRHLPVKKGGMLVGIISIGDVLKHRLDEAQLESRTLRDIAIACRYR
ncbi:MAG: CBS domain-containing protein [Methylocystis sp.]|nr:CBS domain-containing protein [Methylocystis sp.]